MCRYYKNTVSEYSFESGTTLAAHLKSNDSSKISSLYDHSWTEVEVQVDNVQDLRILERRGPEGKDENRKWLSHTDSVTYLNRLSLNPVSKFVFYR